MLKKSKTIKKKKSVKLMQNFLFSYLIILIIPMIFCIYAYAQAISTIDKNASEYHLSMLSQAKTSLETRMQEARLITMQIADDPKVNSLLYAMEKGSETPFQIWEVQQRLQEYTGTNQYISQAYISVQEGHRVISTSYYHKDVNGGKNLNVDGSSNNLLSSLFDYSPGKMVQVQIKDDKVDEKQTLMYVRTFPSGVVNAAYGNICLVFDQDRLEELLTFTNEWTGGYNAILNENSQVLVYSGADPDEVKKLWLSFEKNRDSYTVLSDGEEMYVTYLNSPETGWTYLSIYPKKQVLSETLHVKNLLIVFICLSTAVGILVSILLSLKHTKPVRQIIDVLSGAGELSQAGERDEYSMIRESLNLLISQNHSLTERSHDQKGIVREAMFRMLLSGQKLDMKLFRSMSEEIGMSLEDGCFIGIQFGFELIDIDGAGMATNNERPLAEYVKNILSFRFASEGYAYYLIEHEMLALIYFPSSDRLGIYSVISEIIKEVEAAVVVLDKNTAGNQHRLVIGISNTYSNPEEVFRCAEESRFSSEYSKVFEFGRPVFYDNVSENVNLYKFTLNDHQYLLNILKSGIVDDAQRAFNDLIDRNIVKNKMNEVMIEQLFYAIKGVLLEGADFAGEEEVKEKIISTVLKENDFFASFISLEDLYISIASGIGDKRSKKGNLLVKNICDYLLQEYADSNITLTSAADRFSISEAHLSKLFREYASTSFAAYLEDLRICKAKIMLTEGQLKMVQIAEQTGYNSVESFRRAFKRITGVAPSEFKENLNKNN